MMEDIGPIKEKLKKKIRRSSVMKKKSSILMEDVVSQILPTLEKSEATEFLMQEEDIKRSEENAVKELQSKTLGDER